MIQITDASKEQQIPPLLRLGFRPFFLFGTLFGVVAIAVWVTSLFGGLSFNPYGSSMWWHMHEMLFGFVCAIVAGFLLTAVQTWTGLRGLSSMPLLLLLLLWFAGRLLLLIKLYELAWIAALVDLLFLPCVALLMASYVIRVRQWRNLIFTPLLLGLTLANGLMHSAVFGWLPAGMQLGSTIGVLLITLVIFILGGRVIPFFTSRACGFDKPQPLFWLEFVGAASLLLIIAQLIIGMMMPLPKWLATTLWSSLAISQLLRMARWRPMATLGNPLLWSLHLSYLFIPIGALLAVAFYMGWVASISPAIHSLTVGAMAGLILAMISRVSLGHTGRALKPHPQMTWAFIAIFIAALMRSLLPALIPSVLIWGWAISAVCWVIGFGLFLIHYSKILSSPRADNNPG
jgi:uncharacterized protein involved in response to NO